MTDWISAVLMLCGALFAFVAGLGLHRFDDVFDRMHAATKPSTLGLGLILIGAGIRLADAGASARLVLAFVFAAVTIPAGVHIIAREAWGAGSELSEDALLDEASERRRRERTQS